MVGYLWNGTRLKAMLRRPLMVLLCVLVVLSGTMAARARARSVWDGVYTETQAKRGEAEYQHTCAPCHGPALGGTKDAPELVGDTFLKEWYGKTAHDLFKQILNKMPDDQPGILTPQQSVDLAAHILFSNKFPAGDQELVGTKEGLADIRIEKRK